MKAVAKALLLAVLTWQLQRLRRHNTFKTVAVVGSYGKTSSKFALATVLQQHFRTQYQAGNYNDILTVPLIFFGENLPSLANPFAWALLLLRNERQLRRPYSFDVVVLELGVDGPGQMINFARYLHLDFAVVTAIAYEHMEFFADLSAVAGEELTVAAFADQLIVNLDLCDKSFLAPITKPLISYALKAPADYHIELAKTRSHIHKHGKKWLTELENLTTQPVRYSACAAAAVADQLGMTARDISQGIAQITPASGRMQRLKGIKNSLILDETYNASPDAVKTALDVLYDLEAPQKIALLGNMNELGKYSEPAHREVGAYCNPAELDLLLTLGPHANRSLAEAARKRGCQVITCASPYQAGRYLRQHITEQAAILVKGSQNGVFAEEAVKMILANPQDSQLLVRQSAQWLKIKQKAWKES